MATKAASSMEDTASSVGSSSPPKKVTSTKPTESRAKSTHPTTANMIIEAITELRERGGSSLFAIKKYMTEAYKVDTDKLAFYIKKALKSAVESGQLIQTKGKGASGSFKLPPKYKAKEVQPKAGSSKTSLDNKKAVTKKPSKTAASAKPASPKKKQASSSKVAKKASTENAKKSKKVDPKSPKAKRLARSPTKLKAPKPKKVAEKSPKPSTSRKATVAAK